MSTIIRSLNVKFHRLTLNKKDQNQIKRKVWPANTPDHSRKANGEGMLDKDAARHDDLMTPAGYRCNSGISVFCIILFRYFSGSLIISTQRDRHSGGSNGYAK